MKILVTVALVIAVVPSCSMPATEPAPSTPLPQHRSELIWSTGNNLSRIPPGDAPRRLCNQKA